MGHDHVHLHSAGHFRTCTHPESCFCEVYKYLFAAGCGLFFAYFQWHIGGVLAGSHGAQSDAGHMFADSAFLFTSIFLALWKRHDRKQERRAERLGVVLNSLFLFVAAGVILYRLYFGKEFAFLSSIWMFAAGVFGIVGNLAQLAILHGEDEGEITILSTTRQHVFYDLMYSVAVIAGAILMAMGVPRETDWVIALALAFAMILSAGNNLKSIYVHRE